MHEHSIEMTCLNAANFDGLVTPTHDLTCSNICNWCWHLSPLQDNVLWYLQLEWKQVNHTRALVIRHSETVICTESPHTSTYYHEYQHFQLVWEPQISHCKSTCLTLVHEFIHNQQLRLVISTVPLKKLTGPQMVNRLYVFCITN